MAHCCPQATETVTMLGSGYTDRKTKSKRSTSNAIGRQLIQFFKCATLNEINLLVGFLDLMFSRLLTQGTNRPITWQQLTHLLRIKVSIRIEILGISRYHNYLWG